MECQEESAICCIKATKWDKVSKSVVNTIATYMLLAALSLFPRFSAHFLPFPEYPRAILSYSENNRAYSQLCKSV
jgi:hypothetical protein